MTVREWLQLLIVPLALVVIGFLFSVQQDARQQKIENQRAKAERELAAQRAQDEALQAYLDQMSSLLLNGELRNSEEDSEVRTLARARTLTVLRRLDPSRKSAAMQFLVEAELVQSVEGRGPIIRLSGANFSGASLSRLKLGDFSFGSLPPRLNLGGVYLQDADLSHANLFFADLSDADLSGADVRHANLRYAKLSNADVSDADLRHANLFQADLRHANLLEADLSDADLRKVGLSGATLVNANLKGADLRGANLRDANLSRGASVGGLEFLVGVADLSDADLSDADLSGADVRHADLSGADLSGADVSDADLRHANLSDASGVSEEQLTAAKTLEGATMPNGQKYEDWLKDREKRQQDE